MVGTKVHAVDELSRWEEGRVVRVNRDRVEVKFRGWDDLYNRTVGLDTGEVRHIEPTVEEKE